jgi:hypothetical protein
VENELLTSDLAGKSAAGTCCRQSAGRNPLPERVAVKVLVVMIYVIYPIISELWGRCLGGSGTIFVGR